MRPQRIKIEASIEPATAGDSVLFMLKKPNGSVVTANGVTGINGTATTQFTLNRKDPRGSYIGQVAITVNGNIYSASSAVII